MTYTHNLDALSRTKNDNTALSKIETAIGKISNLDPRKKIELLDRTTNYKAHNDQRTEIETNHHEHNVEQVLHIAEHEFNTFQTLANKNSTLSPKYIDHIIKTTSNTPYQTTIRNITDTVQANDGLTLHPIHDQETTLTTIDAQIAQSGHTPKLNKQRERMAKLTTTSHSDTEHNPLATYTKHENNMTPKINDLIS